MGILEYNRPFAKCQQGKRFVPKSVRSAHFWHTGITWGIREMSAGQTSCTHGNVESVKLLFLWAGWFASTQKSKTSHFQRCHACRTFALRTFRGCPMLFQDAKSVRSSHLCARNVCPAYISRAPRNTPGTATAPPKGALLTVVCTKPLLCRHLTEGLYDSRSGSRSPQTALLTPFEHEALALLTVRKRPV